MTENEVIKHLQSYAGVVDNMIKYCKDFEPKADITRYLEKKTVFAMAISALKEVQKYSEIGTVEECKELASMVTTEKKNVLGIIVDEWNEYIEIGTVEECREAVEKRKPKKPKDSLKINPVIDGNGTYVDADMTVYLLCPNCGEMIGIDESCDKFCRECGQAIDENLEGMRFE